MVKKSSIAIFTIISAAALFYLIKLPQFGGDASVGFSTSPLKSSRDSYQFLAESIVNFQPNSPLLTEAEKKKLSLEHAELKRFNESNNIDIKKITRQILKGEIKSLKKSILNDQQTLKKIKKSGGGRETYRLVEKNLVKRKNKLKELMKRKT